MRAKFIVLAALLWGGVFASVAVADWVAKDASGLNVTFDAFLNGTKQLPKHVIVNPSGVQVGTAAIPLVNSIVQGGNTATVSATGALKVDGSAATQPISGAVSATQSGAWSVGLSGAIPTGANTIGTVGLTGAVPAGTNEIGRVTADLIRVGGSSISNANPVPTLISQGGAPVASGNPLSVGCVSGCASSESTLATYSASTSITLATSATDFFTLQGSASKTIKVRRVILAVGSASSPQLVMSLTRRSAANTGGTSSAVTVAKYDSADNPATAVTAAYTANPSALGTSAGVVRTVNTLGSIGGTVPNVISVPPIVFEFGGDLNSKALLLRGTSEFLAINAGATNTAGGYVVHVTVEWTEE